MNSEAAQVDEFRRTLWTNERRFDVELTEDSVGRLCNYYELLLAWNTRLHLVGPCSPSEFAVRHVLESLLLVPQLTLNAGIADVGSGAGLPIIPNLIVRQDIQATIIEASAKKAVFLREALRITETHARATVIADRFENVTTPTVDYVTCRALDRFTEMFPALVRWSPPESTLLFFGGDTLRREIENAGLKFSARRVPDSDRRFLFVVPQTV